MRILVLSTFDVWPPRDGGQTRYVNLWRNLSTEHDITILAYDFRNLDHERRYRLADNLEVIVPPADQRDAQIFFDTMAETGLWLHDALCIQDYGFSDKFLVRLSELTCISDIVVASHPYLAKLSFPIAGNKIVKVYEGHNVEFDIKSDYFDSSKNEYLAKRFLKIVKDGEKFAAKHANLITTVSQSDALRIEDLYGVDNTTIATIPNGANIRYADLLDEAGRQTVRDSLKIDPQNLVGIFLGSAFAANVESYKQGRQMLQAAGFRGTMLVIGAIDQVPREGWDTVEFEERWLGFVTADLRDVLLSTADFALHLIFSGAGTNLKLFDYMSAGTPIVTNEFGRRGVPGKNWCLSAENPAELTEVLRKLATSTVDISDLCINARNIALSEFDWRSIAAKLEKALTLICKKPSSAITTS